jgi:hypothetical protein
VAQVGRSVDISALGVDNNARQVGNSASESDRAVVCAEVARGEA